MPAKNHSDYSQETRVALLEQTISHVYEVLNELKELNTSTNKKIDDLDKKGDSRFIWTLTFIIGGYASLLGIIGRGFHWW